MKAIITFRFPKNPQHNKLNKKVGVCVVGLECSDMTGEHHSLLIEGEDIEDVKKKSKLICEHITRIEILK